MIRRDDLTAVGEVFKPHGIKGELSMSLEAGLEPESMRCMVLDIDGIFVPFFVASARRRGPESWLVRFDGIDNETQAAALSRHEIFALTAELPDGIAGDDDAEGINLYDLEGFTLADADGSPVGTIDDIDDSTANILLYVTTPDGRTVFVPFADELVAGLDIDGRVISLDIPEGIIDLN